MHHHSEFRPSMNGGLDSPNLSDISRRPGNREAGGINVIAHSAIALVVATRTGISCVP